MKYGQPFGRAITMATAIAAIMSSAVSASVQQSQLKEIGPYESRGKGQGRSNRRLPSIMAHRRAMMKKRNQRKHRLAAR